MPAYLLRSSYFSMKIILGKKKQNNRRCRILLLGWNGSGLPRRLSGRFQRDAPRRSRRRRHVLDRHQSSLLHPPTRRRELSLGRHGAVLCRRLRRGLHGDDAGPVRRRQQLLDGQKTALLQTGLAEIDQNVRPALKRLSKIARTPSNSRSP